MTLNRRKFLAGSGIGVATAALAGVLVRPGESSAVGGPASDSAGPKAGRAPDFDPADWGSVRSQFELSPDWIHLAGLLLSSHPAPVRAAIERHRAGLDDNPAHYLEGDHGGERAVRYAAAAYMGARAEEIALTDSTTMGLALVYNGIEIRPGQEVLTTSHDHRATHESLEYRSRRSGARLRRISLYRQPRNASADEIVGNLVRAVRPETRVVAITWVHSSTGVKLPVRAIAEALAELNAGRDEGDRALLCVDGVHGFGIEDAGMADLGCDFFMAGTHKWLFGPRGTGVVWGSPRSQRFLTPTVPSFTRDGTWGGEMSPGGFKPFEHVWALEEAFTFHQRIGKARVAERIHELNRQTKEGLARMPHVTLYTPVDASLSSGIVCFDVRGMSPAQVVGRLRERGVVASRTPYSPTFARLTPGLLNTPAEIDTALAALRAMG
jgi:isopenicillin-N epimerase